MTSRQLRRLLMGFLVGGVAALCLHAQAPGTAAIVGRILDEQGQPLARATVVVWGIDPKVRRQTETDEEGRFSYVGFLPGRYHLLVLREGEILWSFPMTLPPNQERLLLEIDLQKLRELAEQRMTLDPELERQQEIDRQEQERTHRLQTHYNRGVRHLREDEPEEAIEDFRAALELEPQRATTYAMLGAAYAAAARPEEALAAYQQALAMEPREAAHHNNLGTLLARQGHLEEARQHFTKAAQLDPRRAATYQFNLGAALLNAGRLEEALSWLRQATRRDPTLAVAHFFQGVALFRLSPPQAVEAVPNRIAGRPGTIDAFQRYLQLEPDGEYADQARDYLERLGAPVSDMLLPAVPSPQDLN